MASGLDNHTFEHSKESIFIVEDEVIRWETKEDVKENNGQSRECWPARYTLALLASLGFAVSYSLRVNLSIAIVAMAGTSNITANSSGDACPLPGNGSDSSPAYKKGEFDWDEPTQGLILGAFYYGYTCTNALGGRASEYLGGKLVLGLSVSLSSIISLLSPLCAQISTGLFIASRILMGLCQGVSFPAFNTMMATWFPPEEKAKFGPIILGGMQLGTVIALPVSGWLIASGFLGGWPSVFYVFGVLGLIWGVPWFFMVHDRPEKHPRISTEELLFIQGHEGAVKKAERVPIPWKAIVTSPPMWACIVILFGESFGFFTLLSELPTYLANIQHFDMSSNGVLSAIPYLVFWCTGIGWGFLMDRLSFYGVLSIRMVRRLSTAMASYVPAFAMIAMCFVNCDPVLAMAMLCIAVGIGGTYFSGNALSEQDIAPNLAGTLLGISNTCSGITGFLAPLIVGAIIKGKQESLAAWRWVFVVSAIIYVVTCTFYLLFMSSEVQPWNEPDKFKKGRNVSVSENSSQKTLPSGNT